MQGKSEYEQDNNMETPSKETRREANGGTAELGGNVVNRHKTNTEDDPSKDSPPRPDRSQAEEREEERAWRTNRKTALARGSLLTRSGSIKELIHKFSGPDCTPSSPGSPQLVPHAVSLPDLSQPARMSTPRRGVNPGEISSQSGVRTAAENHVPSIMLTPPPGREMTPSLKETRALADSAHRRGAHDPTQKTDSQMGSVADSGMGSESDFDPNKQPDSPPSEEEPPARRVPPNPKYQLFLGSDMIGSGSRDPDGPAGENGPRVSRWESASSRFGPNYRGSLESLASRDWDTMSDRFGGIDSPPRVFNSPYATAVSMDYNPVYRMADYKSLEGRSSPVNSEYNLYNSRSTSPVLTPTLTAPRTRFSAYDSLSRRRNEVIPNPLNARPTFAAPNKRDYIEELTRQLDACQKRNQFLEAESMEMDKERNQIRFEMRGLLVNNEDLLRTNAQMQGETKRTRDRMQELERDNVAMVERFRLMEAELKEAKDVMVEANTQEYAFNFLQQSLKNKIQDAEEALEKQTLHSQTLSEKLWLSERQLEELEVHKGTHDKRTASLSTTIMRLEAELGDALQGSTQASAELSLEQKLRADAQLRVDELEESLLEKTQELQRVQLVVSRLQGEVSGKLMDKERTLEEEIQLRERTQLQWKQAERTVDDLQMELQSSSQARDDLGKQLKQAQEKMIDLESDLEEMHDSELRWAAKSKRSIEQNEQLQLKLNQEKELSDELERQKDVLERQIRDVRMEVEHLQNSKVQDDVISKTEVRLKELENTLRTEERNKVILTNTIGKLERKINELSDQIEEEHKLATEQKDLMTQRIRSLKRQLNEVEEEASSKEAKLRHAQRELAEERESSTRLQRQLLDQHLQMKRKESSLRMDLSVDEEDLPRSALSTVSKA
ncbi:cingulin-like protein 1 isoform X1 [Osmerus eperlanus]|uniref:cingulin-like protein 1 isoform X1 n=1 Tax=Osmerus eperlanus TaxID=29151 RepID=UPI002E0E5DB4